MGAWLFVSQGGTVAQFWDLSPAQVAFQIDNYVKRNNPKPQKKGGAAELMAIFGQGRGAARMHNADVVPLTVPAPVLTDS